MTDEKEFDVLVNKDGRVMIPEATRIILGIKHNNVLTLVIKKISPGLAVSDAQSCDGK